MSARFPTSIEPVSGKPVARAPLAVAIRSGISPGRTVGSLVRNFWRSVVKRIAAFMSMSLFEPGPSVPIATLTPAAITVRRSLTPIASFM